MKKSTEVVVFFIATIIAVITAVMLSDATASIVVVGLASTLLLDAYDQHKEERRKQKSAHLKYIKKRAQRLSSAA